MHQGQMAIIAHLSTHFKEALSVLEQPPALAPESPQSPNFNPRMSLQSELLVSRCYELQRENQSMKEEIKRLKAYISRLAELQVN